MKKDNLLNQRFGRWTVIAPAESRNGIVYWLCRCDCGTEKEVHAGNLKYGKSKSCGCAPVSPRIDLTGMRFCKLTALSFSRGKWKCICDCGNTVFVSTEELLNGDFESCGCLRKPPRQLQRVCKSCGIEFIGAPRSFYCPSCRLEQQKIYAARSRERARTGKSRKLGQEYFCEICGKPYILKSGLQKFCTQCVESQYRETARKLAKSRFEKNKSRTNPARSDRRKATRTNNKNKINEK